MGCGFSSALKSAHKKRTEETSKTGTNDQPVSETTKFPDRRESLAETGEGNGELKTAFKTFHNRIAEGGCVQSLGEASSSQVNFFKMLDDKIENGIEFDPIADEEESRREFLQSVEEWDQIIGKNMDASMRTNSSLVPSSSLDENGQDSDGTFIQMSVNESMNSNPTVIQQQSSSSPLENATKRVSSVDSMRTMFSNSAGSSSSSSVPCDPVLSLGNSSSSNNRTIGGKDERSNRPKSDHGRSPSSAKSLHSSDDLSHSNRSICLNNVLQES
ncbi:hypothetical protein TCAL_00351 [Tigriopus californicus]|uniref:Uncharacterized protein n=1 Tax=Tigriopus californicus TaxID=6832 RepID=A0A553NBQ6_TIGCA|nr:uncharacterized protein LOC131888376 [Tigriopus californicus]TRY62884.1 hypothetical protein TCAL_00351 [Tigriopus californicus]|eukprot:TCALIF_00351-PA protein Name:"Protein of unknown function" AED:0.00 eAED:0.00 QI:1307/1/1/1/1/1/4/234/271